MQRKLSKERFIDYCLAYENRKVCCRLYNGLQLILCNRGRDGDEHRLGRNIAIK